jgi:PAS domain S-box-containing protein
LFDFSLFSILYFIAGFLLLVIGGVIWSRRPAQGLVLFTLFLCATALWSVFAGLEAGAGALSARILFTKIQYIGVVSSGILWLLFTLEYTGRSWWKRPRYIILLCLIPLIALGLTWTNEMHRWIWSNVYIVNDSGLLYSVWVKGPLYMINPLYQYALYSSGFLIFLIYGLKQPPFYRKQVLIILAGTSMPFIYNIFYVIGFSPIKGMDMTPLWMLAGALVYTFTILSFRFLNVLPVAYQTLVNSLPDSILILDTQNRMREMNLVAEKLMQVKRLSAKGQSIQVLWPDLAQQLQEVVEGQNVDLSMSGKNGPLFFAVNHVTLRDNQGYPVGKLVTIRDITELKTIHKELEAEIQKRSQYSRALVHELRTPLTSIIASSDMLESVVKEPIQLSLTRNIQRAAHNLDQRVAELFELARGEIGLITIDSAPLDLCLLIEEVVAEIDPVAEKKGLTLAGECAQGLIIMGDKSRLRQVLSNLLSNAIKFTEKGRIQVNLSASNNQQALIQVSDSGQGIPPDQMLDLFDPYRRKTPANQTNSGLGIGLALSKIIIELHQGKIWAESSMGKGTTISFTLPLKKINSE